MSRPVNFGCPKRISDAITHWSSFGEVVSTPVFDAAASAHPLDNPAFAALTGPQARFAERYGNAVRFAPDVCPMGALPSDPDASDWADLAGLIGPQGSVFLPVVSLTPPPGWATRPPMPGVQMIAEHLATAPDDEAVALSAADVPEMLDLVRRTDPGPFRDRTIEMGTYLGIRREGALIAMAGERLHVPGWTEISAVCTDPAYQGLGLAGRLIRAVGHGITERGEIPFLHAAAVNAGAIRLYEDLGFRLRANVVFQTFIAPG